MLAVSVCFTYAPMRACASSFASSFSLSLVHTRNLLQLAFQLLYFSLRFVEQLLDVAVNFLLQLSVALFLFLVIFQALVVFEGQGTYICHERAHLEEVLPRGQLRR